jgi:hypothetical protein
MGQTLENLDAGALRAGWIGDFMWLDLNGNGLQDDDEPGLDRVQVELQGDAGGSWKTAASTRTDADGWYELGPVRPGAYRLRVTLPSETFPTQPQPELSEINSKLPWRISPVLDTEPFQVRTGQRLRNQDAGFVSMAWAAENGWAAQSDGNIWIPPASDEVNTPSPTASPALEGTLLCQFSGEGARVMLFLAEGTLGAPLAEGVSDAEGRVLFEGLAPGWYRLFAVLPEEAALAGPPPPDTLWPGQWREDVRLEAGQEARLDWLDSEP